MGEGDRDLARIGLRVPAESLPREDSSDNDGVDVDLRIEIG